MEDKGISGFKLYTMFVSLWSQRFTSAHLNNDFIETWCQLWQEALKNTDAKLINDAVNYCANNFEWPPTLAEFRSLCERGEAIPSPRECLQLAVRRDFSHPIVKTIFDKVGSWALSHDKESDLLKTFEKLHQEALADIRTNARNTIKLVQDNTQGSVEHDTKQGIARDTRRGTGLHKVEKYLL